MKKFLRNCFETADNFFDAAFTPSANPMQQLGAMGWFFYWIVIASGIYLYIFFDTGITQAYDSVESLTHTQWYAGGVMRSLHRYASDALVIVVLLHLLREYALDRMHGPRYFSWITGVALLWLLYASGITGYWIVWDKLAQYVAIATSEWLDTLPIFGESIARNFLHDSTLSGRFFTLFVFIHIAVPLFMLFLMWIHIQRISLPRTNPPKALAQGTLVALLVLSLVAPAVSQGPAELNMVPARVNLDWFYMFFYPLLDRYPGLLLWGALFSLTALLMVLPWLVLHKRPALVAKVNLDNCNGCGRCVLDCPYSAIDLRPRSDDLPYPQEAVVDTNLCVGCGICAGACPTATPFRRRSDLVPGIELQERTINKLKEDITQASSRLEGKSRIIVFGCEYGHNLESMQSPDVAALNIPCIGMIPPPFLDFILSRNLADGIVLTGCRENGCYHRFGIDWTTQRIASQRDPFLRERVPRERITYCWTGILNRQNLHQEIESFRNRLKRAGDNASDKQNENSRHRETSCIN